MPNHNYINGVRKERKIVNDARAKGHIAFRSAGSHSPIDVIIIDEHTHVIHLIQCKPKSMSDNKKRELLESLVHLNGVYGVVVSVV
jgi:Holliday junction resolvase